MLFFTVSKIAVLDNKVKALQNCRAFTFSATLLKVVDLLF